MGYIEKTYGRSEKFLAFKVCFYDTLVPTREYKSGYEWTGRAHGSLADALATLAVQRWLEQWLVAE